MEHHWTCTEYLHLQSEPGYHEGWPTAPGPVAETLMGPCKFSEELRGS